VSEFQHHLEGPAANHDYIGASEELFSTVRLLLAVMPEIERVVRSSEKAIEAHSAED
jgi:hypothetical protein